MSTGISFLTEPRRFASARVAYRYAGSSVAINNGDPWRWDTEASIVPKVGNWELSNTTYAVKIPVDGYYRFSANAFTTSSGNVSHSSDGASFSWEVDTGSGFTARCATAASPASTRTATSVVSFQCKAGDWVRIVNSNVTFTQQTNTLRFLIIERITDTSHGQPVGYALATADRAGLLPYYNETVIDLSVDAAVSAGTIKIVRVGSMVTVTGLTVITAASSINDLSVAGVVPAWARPTTQFLPKTHRGGSTLLIHCSVEPSGAFRAIRTDYSGSGSNGTSFSIPSFSYAVE